MAQEELRKVPSGTYLQKSSSLISKSSAFQFTFPALFLLKVGERDGLSTLPEVQ
jgi:hypothetical protein